MIKEHACAIVNQSPFNMYLHRLIVKMVYNITFWLNAFSYNDGVHDVMSLHTIITGLQIDHNRLCHL